MDAGRKYLDNFPRGEDKKVCHCERKRGQTTKESSLIPLEKQTIINNPVAWRANYEIATSHFRTGLPGSSQ